MPSDRETKLCALLVLDQIPGIGLKTLAALVACFGSGRVFLTVFAEFEVDGWVKQRAGLRSKRAS